MKDLAPDVPLKGLFADDTDMLAIPRIGDAWESSERAVSAALEADTGLRLSDLLALDRIHRAGKEGIRTNALARALRIPSNRLTYQLAGLQKRRYIARSSHPEDGRGVVLRLTKAGREAHKRALASYRRITRNGLRGLDSGLDPDRLIGAAAVLSGDAPTPADVQRLLDALGADSVDSALARLNGNRRPRSR